VIDEAIRSLKVIDTTGYTKVDEVPYDFIRKRLSVVVSFQGKHTMITKGAIDNILQVCTRAEVSEGNMLPISEVRAGIEGKLTDYNRNGFRTIAIAWKDVTEDPVITKDDEEEMTFLGFIVMFDPPKKGVSESLSSLKRLGIKLKLISGDNRLVVQYLGEQVGLSSLEVLTGSQMHKLTSEALQGKVTSIDLFAEIEPAQKEWIIKSLQKTGHTVGYLGDGINDANALRAADVGISIDNAVDVAKEAADLVLLQQNLDVICEGVTEGRKTFNNTLKYIFITTSANFGNMFSMALASLLLPFLPLLPTQILLNNFLSDMPALAIASDRVDAELMQKPTKWDINKIKRFMIVFGIQSSMFDFATFALLLFVFKAGTAEFRTGWFIESLLSEILILLVIRTERPFFKSMPSRYLFMASCITFVLALLIPYLPFASVFSFIPLPLTLLSGIVGISVVYILVAEVTKQYFMKRV
jgi:Mg2+-importing ATPase